jgi:hypothetical protein
MQAITAHLMSEREEKLIHSGNPEKRSTPAEPAGAAS